jgi:hypothetical protein
MNFSISAKAVTKPENSLYLESRAVQWGAVPAEKVGHSIFNHGILAPNSEIPST